MKKLYIYIKPAMGMILFGAFLKLVGTAVDLILPYMLSNMVDIGIANANMAYILKLSVIMIVIALISFFAGLVSHYFASKASQCVSKRIRESLYSHLQQLPQQTIDAFSAASLTSRVTADVERIQSFISSTMRMMVRVGFLTVGGIAMAMLIDPFVTLALGCSMVIVVVMSRLVYKLTNPVYKTVQAGLDSLSNIVREGLFGIKTIKAFDKYEHEMKRFQEKCRKVKDNEITAGKITAFLSPSITVVTNIGLVVILIVSGMRVNGGYLEVGQIIAIVSYINMILNAMVAVPRIFLMYSRASASAARITEIFDQPIEQRPTKALKTESTDSVIEFTHVGFSYTNSNKDTLKDITFTIKEGTTTAIVGETGCGKTTLINLLSGLYAPTSGQVRILGNDISHYPLKQLHEIIGVAFQQYNIFSMSIAKNVILNQPYDGEKVAKSMEQTQMEEFVDTLENGAETVIAQAGANLSGGQKQRLNLARIFYKKPQIIILDDVTSALDFKTDYLIRKELKTLDQAKAILIIAGRISSIKDCENILVMKNGTIVGNGTHESLLASCAEYQGLYRSQSEVE